MNLNQKGLDPHSIFSKKLRNQAIKYLFSGILSLRLVLSLIFIGFPVFAEAGVFSVISSIFNDAKAVAASPESFPNSQVMPLLQASLNSHSDAIGGGDITVSGNALLAENGPSGTIADIKDHPQSDQISIYVVKPGENLGQIAKMFDVSVGTIAIANDIKGGNIQPGQTLVILPVDGIKYTVKAGDTPEGLAKKFSADANEILQFNDLPGGKLVTGAQIIIPDAESAFAPAVVAAPVARNKNVALHPTSRPHGYNGPDLTANYSQPIPSGCVSQRVHGNNGVDVAASYGTAIHASGSGIVIIIRTSGWNGGYGKYVAVQNNDGTQTLDAHMSEVAVTVGQRVSRGQIIGYVGLTGNTTGPHVHHEARGRQNEALKLGLCR